MSQPVVDVKEEEDIVFEFDTGVQHEDVVTTMGLDWAAELKTKSLVLHNGNVLKYSSGGHFIEFLCMRRFQDPVVHEFNIGKLVSMGVHDVYRSVGIPMRATLEIDGVAIPGLKDPWRVVALIAAYNRGRDRPLPPVHTRELSSCNRMIIACIVIGVLVIVVGIPVFKALST